MRLPSSLALTISLTAALTLAVPALAENGTPPDPIPAADLPERPEEPEVKNPVTIGDCLPDETTDHGEGDGDENSQEDVDVTIPEDVKGSVHVLALVLWAMASPRASLMGRSGAART